MKIFFFACLFVASFGCRGVSSQTLASEIQWQNFEVLSKASSLVNLEKNNISAAEGKKNPKATVYLFLSARCPCSNSHNQEVKSLTSSFPEIQFVGVHSNADEPREEAEKYFRSAGFSFPVVQDKNDKLSNALGALKTPHAFLVNAKGEVLYRGGVSSSRVLENAERKYLREGLEDFTAGRSLRTTEARSLGCVIARGK